MRENGIVGAGGAGFPSYAKLNQSVDTLIINVAECEPLLRVHRQLMENKTVEVLTAVSLIGEVLGVKNVLIGIKAAYKKAVDAIEANLSSFPTVKLSLLSEVYPAGDEVVLIYEATHRVVGPGKLPSSVGVVVYNIETAYNVYRALQGYPCNRKLVTIAGEVKEPRTYYAPIGTKFSDLIKLSGGSLIEDPEYLVGGPMMGFLGRESDVVTKTTNAVILLPKDHPVVLRKRTKVKIDMKRAMAACCQCSYCTDMCPRHLLGHPINPANFMRVVSNQDSHTVQPYLDAMFCSGCGVCETYACHQGLSPRALIGAFKNQLRAQGVRPPVVNEEPVPEKNRELKLVPIHRLVSRLSLEKYDRPAPLDMSEIDVKEVSIKLSQHIGVPATPIVKVGDYVQDGEVIAMAVEGKLSVNIHASISGKVVEVTDKLVIIRK